MSGRQRVGTVRNPPGPGASLSLQGLGTGGNEESRVFLAVILAIK